MERDDLACRHLDQRLARLQKAGELARPPSGWLCATRDSLGMMAAQLAARLQVSQPRIVEMEKAEQRGAIMLDTLKRAARALDCTLVNALVSNGGSLYELVRKQARKVAAETLSRVDHSMKLEGQGVSAKTTERRTGTPG